MHRSGPLTASVVVCTRNRPELLERCLAAVQSATVPLLETIVVDNASTTPGIEEIARRHGARYVHEPKVGTSRARNTGLRDVSADVAVFVDDDAYPSLDWIEHLLAPFSDPLVAAVAGRTIAIAGGETTDDAAAMSDLDGGPTFKVIDGNAGDWFERTNFGGIGAGANMAFRTSAVTSWGGFDERLGYGTAMPGLEEHNAFFRIVRNGYRVVYAPESVVYHPITHAEDEAKRRRRARVRSSAAYMILLFVEYREYRRRLLRMLSNALRRRTPSWRDVPSHDRLNAFELLAVTASAPLLYLRTRLRSRRTV